MILGGPCSGVLLDAQVKTIEENLEILREYYMVHSDINANLRKWLQEISDEGLPDT